MPDIPEPERADSTWREAGPGSPAAVRAIDLPETAEALRRYRRRAGDLVNAGVTMLLAVPVLVVVGVSSGVDDELLTTFGPMVFAFGWFALALGIAARVLSRRMRRALGSQPWTAHASVTAPKGRERASVVLAVGLAGDALVPLAPITSQWRFELLREPSGVLWWCGDPRTGGVLAPPGGGELIWAGPLRGRRAQRALARRQVQALAHRRAPFQPQPRPQPQDRIPAPAVRVGPPLTQSPVEGEKARRRGWWRGAFRWAVLVGLIALVLSGYWAGRSSHDPQVDLTVLSEQSNGDCTVRWTDPFDDGGRTGPFHCDSGRDPLLAYREIGFVVSYGPWKGDLYTSDLRGTSAYDDVDSLGLGGFVLVLAGFTGGAVRHVRGRRLTPAPFQPLP